MGGQANLRPSWATYFPSTDAVILVVDSTDRARIGIAQQELFTLLKNIDLAGACILVFANKQDLRDAMPPAELSEALNLVAIKTHNWHIQSACALTGDGLLEGMKWVAQTVKNKGSGAPPP